MANSLYAKGREGFLSSDIDWDANTIKCVFLDGADYTPNLSTHDNLDDVPSAARVGTAQTLANKTVTDGIADADDVTFTALTGDQVEYILIYKDTGTESTSRLIALIDTATGLPLTPSGSNVTISWSNGADKIFKL